jgi:hypothetical protein
MKKKSSLLFLLLLAVPAIYFFQDYNTHNTSNWKDDQNQTFEGFGFSIYHTFNPLVGMNRTQHLKVNENLEGYLDVANAMKKGNKYLLFALLDYKQIPFYFNGSKNETHLISLGPMEEELCPFKIEGLPPGFHDLLFVIFLNPYEHSLNSSYRYDTDFSMMGSKRLNVIVGNGSAVIPEFKNFYAFAKSGYPLEGLLVNKEPCSSKSWLVENVTKNQTLKYYINLGNNDNFKHRTCAIVQFLDYKQIPIRYNNSEYVFFGYLNKGKKGSIPASLKVPDIEGVQELIVVWISDPYENLEISPGIRNTKLEDQVEPSIRIGLNIDGKK